MAVSVVAQLKEGLNNFNVGHSNMYDYSEFLKNKNANEYHAISRNDMGVRERTLLEMDEDMMLSNPASMYGEEILAKKGDFLDVTEPGNPSHVSRQDFIDNYKTTLKSAFNNAVEKADDIRKKMEPSVEQVMAGVQTINTYYDNFWKACQQYGNKPSMLMNGEERAAKARDQFKGVFAQQESQSPAYEMV